jgi:hypothetical protein
VQACVRQINRQNIFTGSKLQILILETCGLINIVAWKPAQYKSGELSTHNRRRFYKFWCVFIYFHISFLSLSPSPLLIFLILLLRIYVFLFFFLACPSLAHLNINFCERVTTKALLRVVQVAKLETVRVQQISLKEETKAEMAEFIQKYFLHLSPCSPASSSLPLFLQKFEKR